MLILINDKSLGTTPATSNRELEILPLAFSHRGSNETLVRLRQSDDRNFNLEPFLE